MSQAELLLQYGSSIQDDIARFETTGSKVVMDGQQAKENVAIDLVHGLAADGIPIPSTIPS
jgi:hypothetical protein